MWKKGENKNVSLFCLNSICLIIEKSFVFNQIFNNSRHFEDFSFIFQRPWFENFVQKHSIQCCHSENAKTKMLDFAWRNVPVLVSKQKHQLNFEWTNVVESSAYTQQFRWWIAIHKTRRQTQPEYRKNQLIESRENHLRRNFVFVNVIILVSILIEIHCFVRHFYFHKIRISFNSLCLLFCNFVLENRSAETWKENLIRVKREGLFEFSFYLF